jgi:ribosomal protein S18 acetylase RimI-like enzyme
MIEVRPVRREELSMLRKVAIETFIASFAEFNTAENMEAFLKEAYRPGTLEKEWMEGGSVCYLAWDENDLIGFVRLRLNDEVENQLGKNTIELQRLYVHPLHQGKKVGSLLMKRAVDYSLEQGYDWIWLGVWERNFKAQEFYAKWGFERFGKHIFQMGDDPQTDWLLRKRVIR